MKTIALLPAHPSQIWVLDELSKALSEHYKILWFCRDKDVSIELARQKGISYILLSKASNSFIGNGFELFFNIFKCIYYTKKYNINLWITKYGAGNIAALLSGSQSISFNDDDSDIVPFIAWTSYPFAKKVLAPQCTRQGFFHKKFRTYNSFHELFYLHPKRFQANSEIYKQLKISPSTSYAIIRLSALKAHHDINIKGISFELIEKLISLLVSFNIVPFITSEDSLTNSLKKYHIDIPVSSIHQALYFSSLYIGDSQTMASEAAVLGTPVFRFSDFSHRLSYLDELETYGLIKSYLTHQEDKFLADIKSFLQLPNTKKEFNHKREKLLNDKEDPIPFFISEIKNSLTKQ